MLDDEISTPEDYLCPISHEIMKDPVMAADGQTYDRESITNWLSRKRGRSPLDGSKLPHTNLTDNLFARKIIKEYQRKLPEQRDLETKLEKTIQQKEEIIKTLMDKLDIINSNEADITTNVTNGLRKEIKKLLKHNIQQEEKNMRQDDVINDLNKEIAVLKKQIIQPEEKITKLKGKNMKQKQVTLKKKNIAPKKQTKKTNTQSTKLSKSLYNPTMGDEYNKRFSYELGSKPLGLLELNDEFKIACFTKEGIKLFDHCALFFDFNKSIPFKINRSTPSIQQKKNGNIIFESGDKELTICDKDFNLIESFKQSSYIFSLCNISEFSFAIGLQDGTIKIYSKNSNSQKYEVKKYKYHSKCVNALGYLPELNYLLSGSKDNIINVLSISEGEVIKTLTEHSDWVYSFISLKEGTFASFTKNEIKFWSIKENFTCVETIKAHEDNNHNRYLPHITKLLVTISDDQFKVWDFKDLQCLYNYKENSFISGLILTKHKTIITITDDNKINVWQVAYADLIENKLSYTNKTPILNTAPIPQKTLIPITEPIPQRENSRRCLIMNHY
jgi:WD40 repeat protein